MKILQIKLCDYFSFVKEGNGNKKFKLKKEKGKRFSKNGNLIFLHEKSLSLGCQKCFVEVIW